MNKFKLRSVFIHDKYDPYILIFFQDGSLWKYSGIELGEWNILKHQFNHKPGTLVTHLKSLSYIKSEKIT